MKKVKLFVLSFIFMLFLVFCSAINVNASRAVIIKNENPEGVTVLTIDDELYYILTSETDENYGYVVYSNNENEVIIGSCSIIVYSDENPSGYVYCNVDSNFEDLGVIEVNIIDNINNIGIVRYVSNSSNGIFTVGTKINFS